MDNAKLAPITNQAAEEVILKAKQAAISREILENLKKAGLTKVTKINYEVISEYDDEGGTSQYLSYVELYEGDISTTLTECEDEHYDLLANDESLSTERLALLFDSEWLGEISIKKLSDFAGYEQPQFLIQKEIPTFAPCQVLSAYEMSQLLEASIESRIRVSNPDSVSFLEKSNLIDKTDFLDTGAAVYKITEKGRAFIENSRKQGW